MKGYLSATPEVGAMVREVMEAHHPRLIEAGVTVSAWMALGGLKHQGYAAAGIIKKNGVLDRMEGKADATMKLCAEQWEELDDASRRALIDHELTHLDPVIESYVTEGPEKGQPIYETDGAGRPVLKIRLHDWQLGGFAEVVERHGEAALDKQEFRRACERFKQALFEWGDDSAPQTDQPKRKLKIG